MKLNMLHPIGPLINNASIIKTQLVTILLIKKSNKNTIEYCPIGQGNK